MIKMGHMVGVRIVGSNWNGTDETPAVVTRVWNVPPEEHFHGPSHAMVNVKMFPDCMVPGDQTSVPIYRSEEEAKTFGTAHYAYGWLM
jgi:hypothetical protein